ncbi:hypothetical protein [Macrococcus armenti]|uniref:hypothetical protein n=1 Tax=Macrococcus armenti TaxID=2875764 RepID=UPI001CD37E60|nr:hypothetical protein [Macrococcus armenti]UBH10611.1 hypothetical protein LAU38_10290 [Macrococcus armenti]
MKSRRHRAIYWAYTCKKKKHKVTRFYDELESRFNIAKAMSFMVSKALNKLGEAVSKLRVSFRDNKHLKRS